MQTFKYRHKMIQVTQIQLTTTELKELITSSISTALITKNEHWLTHEQAAEYLQIDISTLHRMKRAGKVKFSMLDSSPRYKKEDLDATLKS